MTHRRRIIITDADDSEIHEPEEIHYTKEEFIAAGGKLPDEVEDD